MNILAPLKPIIFQPSAYNLTDHGAVAIVEMNILSSGKRLFLVGGGSFQGWQASIFKKTNSAQKVKCRNELCKGVGLFIIMLFSEAPLQSYTGDSLS